MVAANNAIDNTVGASISGVTNTMTIQNPSNTASSAAQVLITVGGTTSGSPWIQWTVGTTESFALGQNNSASQRLYLNYNNSASVSPTTGANMLRFDHTAPGIVLNDAAYIVFNTSALAVGSVANNGVSIYEKGTYTPTVVGGTTTGVTTYTVQTGYYVRYQGLVDLYGQVAYSSITGTGDLRLGSYPFTLNTGFGGAWGSMSINSNTTPWPAGRTQVNLFGQANQTYGTFNCIANGVVQANMQVTNTGNSPTRFSLFYRV